jgi:hypothetical protein
VHLLLLRFNNSSRDIQVPFVNTGRTRALQDACKGVRTLRSCAREILHQYAEARCSVSSVATDHEQRLPESPKHETTAGSRHGFETKYAEATAAILLALQPLHCRKAKGQKRILDAASDDEKQCAIRSCNAGAVVCDCGFHERRDRTERLAVEENGDY